MKTLAEFEQVSLLTGLCRLAIWYGLENIDVQIKERREVSSRLWLTITFALENQNYSVDGSTLKIVKEKLFRLLRELERLGKI